MRGPSYHYWSNTDRAITFSFILCQDFLPYMRFFFLPINYLIINQDSVLRMGWVCRGRGTDQAGDELE